MKYIPVLVLIISAAFARSCLLDEPSSISQKSAIRTVCSSQPNNADFHNVLVARLHLAIATHPDSEVRNDFFPLIKNGKIFTAWAQRPLSGQFALVRPQEMRPRRPETDPVPTLVIDPHLLSDPHEATMLALVIYHEYMHYLQWASGRWPNKTFILKRVEEMENPNEWCEQKWYAEVEAYRKECMFAGKIEAFKLLSFCTAKGELDRDQYKETMRGDPMAAFCGKVWSAL